MSVGRREALGAKVREEHPIPGRPGVSHAYRPFPCRVPLARPSRLSRPPRQRTRRRRPAAPCWPSGRPPRNGRPGGRRSCPRRRWPPASRTSPPRPSGSLHIFCSGACSHLDTWDYKPELIKRDGQPMPGGRQAGHLPGRQRQPDQKPLWTFRPRGQSGKYVSRPAAAPGRAGRRDVLHPLDDGQEPTRTGRPRPR